MDKMSELRDSITKLFGDAIAETAEKVRALERRVVELDTTIAAREERLRTLNAQVAEAEKKWGFLQQALGR